MTNLEKFSMDKDINFADVEDFVDVHSRLCCFDCPGMIYCDADESHKSCKETLREWAEMESEDE